MILAFNLHARMTEIRALLAQRKKCAESHRNLANAPSLKSLCLTLQSAVTA